MNRSPWLKPNSAIEGVTWPAIPDPKSGLVLAVMQQLDESQWWPAQDLLEHQMWQLETVLAHAAAQCPFHRERLAAIGYEPGPVPTIDMLRKLPVMTRRDLQTRQDEIRAARIPSDHGRIGDSKTSGSTGEPVVVGGSDLATFFWRVFNLRNHRWHRLDLMGKLCLIKPMDPGAAEPPDGANFPDWDVEAYPSGEAAALSIRADISVQARWLIRHEPDCLVTLPSNLEALAEHFIAAGRSLPSLKAVETTSETLTPAAREACRAAFGVPVIDMYSSTEGGVIALQCPETMQYHVQAENVLAEVVDDNGEACGPGECGRVLLTTLHNFAMPLIRYEIGDYAEMGESCACGRGLPTWRRILGRVRNMLVLPNGERRWPFSGYRMYRDIAPVRQFQLVQTSTTDIEARFVVDAPLSEAQQEALRSTIRRSLGHPFAVTIRQCDRLPRSAGGKFEEFISELEGSRAGASE